ncbi:hypothetical protein CYMTET_19474 [Cymbomonas tetramitiformis]|uniref:Uncharacterized protein n=1 Tax=Cymbomonas tetramitiformis TaxID=36881 RepID=A0AAE0G5Y9_9CHLO|nr:hypothetical protein CYMTET_19474 [Cymbomonas tetramitiformis]
MQLVLEYFQSTMREGVDAVLLHHGGTATAYEYYEKPAALGRCRDSPDQIFHLDIWPFAIETALGAVHPEHPTTIACFEPLSAAEARARIVVDFADVAMLGVQNAAAMSAVSV